MLNELRRALESTREDSVRCNECKIILPEYIDDELEGINVDEKYADFAWHIQVCPHCADEYRELKSSVDFAYHQQLPVLEQGPTVSLGFLDSSPLESSLSDIKSADNFWQTVESMGQEVRRLFTEIPLQLGQSFAIFGTLPPILTPEAVAYAPVRSDSQGIEEQGAQLLPLLDSEHNLSITPITSPVTNNETELIIQVATASSNQPLERVRVLLYNADRQMLASQLTNALGRSQFPHIQVGTYWVHVRYQEKSWELSFIVVSNHEKGG